MRTNLTEDDLELRLPLVRNIDHIYDIVDEENAFSATAKGGFQFDQSLPPYSCSCSVCFLQSRGKIKTAPQFSIEDSDLMVYGLQKSFIWLAEKLGEASLDKGIRINIPETAAFKQGKPAFILSPSRDKTLKFIKSADKLKVQEMIKNFANVVKFRKRETVGGGGGVGRRQRTIISSKPNPSDHRNEIMCARYFIGDKDNFSQNLHPRDEEGPIKVMDENEIFQIIYENPGVNYWKHISYLQTALKCRNGIGESVLFTYYSHKKEDIHAIGELKNAGVTENPELEDRLQNENQTEYCKLICQRIAYFLAVHTHFELLKMQAEFVSDENGKMWLIFANKIFVREIQMDNEAAPLVFKKVKIISEERKQNLESKLKISSVEKSVCANRLSSRMKEYYENLKEKNGINVLFEPTPSVGTLSEDFFKLRPLMRCAVISPKNDPYRKKKKRALKLAIDTQFDGSLSSPNTLSQKRFGWSLTPKIQAEDILSKALSSRSKMSSTGMSRFFTSASTNRLDTN
ncbi:unnamed protein product [Blepharisma stoltei]|uniref:Uncharacterized protein n=1 Tax=Blepharisma stoltei TaxID=1481888 RepID=A0AAU9JZC1_9CILI|nr:unnamed protein product [Blepharisma stoltei]